MTAACLHPASPIVVRTCSNGAVQYVRQCATCGEVVGQAVKKADALAERANPPPFDAALLARQRQAERQRQDDQRQADAEGRELATQQRREEYGQYRASVHWKERCRLVFVREGWLCEACRQARATEVHHQTYEHIFHEPLWELRAVCRVCHARLHPEEDR